MNGFASNPVPRLYRAVVDDVVKNVREAFLNEGVDEQVLHDLKQLWENKLLQSRAIDFIPADPSVRMNLTYPLAMPVSHEKQRGEKVAVTAQVGTNDPATGQMIYVGNHPSLSSLQHLSAPAAQAVLALQGSRHDASTSSGMGATGQHAVATSVQHIQTTLPQQIKQTQQRQELHQKLQSYQQIQRNLQSQQPGHILQHVIHQQQQQQRQQQLQQQQPGSSVQHSIPHHQQHRSQKTQQQQHHQQQQQQVQQSAGIQVLPGEPATTLYGVTPNARGPRVIYTQPVQPQQQQERIIASKQIIQVDGANDSSSDDDDDEDDENFDDYDQYPIGLEQKAEQEADHLEGNEEIEPLNSDDDISDEDPDELFGTENVVVCQYDKIARSKNKWKFYLKDGIMNLRAKDYVFHKANGESEW